MNKKQRHKPEKEARQNTQGAAHNAILAEKAGLT
jgi:hypothetical protein